MVLQGLVLFLLFATLQLLCSIDKFDWYLFYIPHFTDFLLMIAYLCPINDSFELLYFQRNKNEPVKVDQLTVSLYLISD